MIPIAPLNVNARELCRAIRMMESINQMNSAIWQQASDSPLEFIKFVHTNFFELQAEYETLVHEVAVIPQFLRQDLNDAGYANKIKFIRGIRLFTGMGLADSKHFVENLPKEGKYFYFNSINDAESSLFYRWCCLHLIRVNWIPIATTDGLLHFNDFIAHKKDLTGNQVDLLNY